MQSSSTHVRALYLYLPSIANTTHFSIHRYHHCTLRSAWLGHIETKRGTNKPLLFLTRVFLAKKKTGLLRPINKEASVDHIVDHTLAQISVRSSRILSKSTLLSDIERE
jgi:hypothetical protein